MTRYRIFYCIIITSIMMQLSSCSTTGVFRRNMNTVAKRVPGVRKVTEWLFTTDWGDEAYLNLILDDGTKIRLDNCHYRNKWNIRFNYLSRIDDVTPCEYSFNTETRELNTWSLYNPAHVPELADLIPENDLGCLVRNHLEVKRIFMSWPKVSGYSLDHKVFSEEETEVFLSQVNHGESWEDGKYIRGYFWTGDDTLLRFKE